RWTGPALTGDRKPGNHFPCPSVCIAAWPEKRSDRSNTFYQQGIKPRTDYRYFRTGLTGGERKSFHLCGRRYGRYDLFWISHYHDSGSRNFPSIRPWNGIQSRSRNSDGKCDGEYHGYLSGYGGRTFCSCKYK